MRKFEGFQRGVNLGGWVSQCVSRDKEHFDTFITKKDIEQIAGWGLDHVRLHRVVPGVRPAHHSRRT